MEPPKRRVQVPQLLIAVFLVVVSALAAVVLFSRASARDSVLALANSVERGELITADDLMVVYVATDDQVITVPSASSASLVGLAAVTGLEPGTILTPALLTSGSLLEAGDGVVGLALSPGEYPTPLMAAGDRVDVVIVGAAGDVDATPSETVAAGVEVFDVAELGTQGDRFVSLRVPVDVAGAVAEGAAADRVRLVLVASSGGDR